MRKTTRASARTAAQQIASLRVRACFQAHPAAHATPVLARGLPTFAFAFVFASDTYHLIAMFTYAPAGTFKATLLAKSFATLAAFDRSAGSAEQARAGVPKLVVVQYALAMVQGGSGKLALAACTRKHIL